MERILHSGTLSTLIVVGGQQASMGNKRFYRAIGICDILESLIWDMGCYLPFYPNLTRIKRLTWYGVNFRCKIDSARAN